MRVLLRSTTELSGGIGPDRPIDLHRRLPGYEPTPLVEAPDLARALGVGRVLVKDETCRFGLPSFKVLGASFATLTALVERLGPLPDRRLSHRVLEAWAAPLRPLTLMAATDGNHGRAVARVARWFGLEARIYLPSFVSPARIHAIQGEGAEVVVVKGAYDASVDAALEAALDPGTLLISDTARSADDPMPKRVTAGYTTIFAEVDRQLAERRAGPMTAVAIQAGVGGLAAACTGWARSLQSARRPRVAVVEPAAAASVMTALAANEPVGITADEVTAMSVLQCGTVSLTALDTLKAGVSCCLAVDDRFAGRAAAMIREAGVDTGLSGAAGLAGLLAVQDGPMTAAVRGHLGLGADASVLVVATEAATASAPALDDRARGAEDRIALPV